MKKRLVSILLALSMLCSAVPVPVYAEDQGQDTTAQTAALAETTPAQGETTPAQGETTPNQGETTPAEGETTPNQGETTPAEGETTPAQGETTPAAQRSLLGLDDEVSTLAVPTTLTVGGTNVLGGCWKTNADGTLTADGASESDYNVKYDSATGTLTLKDATINGTDTIYHVGAGIFASGDLTIVLEGSSTVKGVQDPNGETQSIRVEGNLTIQGGGSLTARGLRRAMAPVMASLSWDHSPSKAAASPPAAATSTETIVRQVSMYTVAQLRRRTGR